MKILKPKKLSKGSVIGIIAPASFPSDPIKINNGVKYLEKLGYKVEVGKSVWKQRGYLAGNDSERLDDLHRMFSNKNIKAIFCVRGGYGTGRLLDKIDFSIIRKNPKIFVGYSDITALQSAFFQKAGLITFAGPMTAVDFYENVNQFTEETFWRTITSTKKIGKIHNPNNDTFFSLNKGKGEGRLLGGNLAVLTSIIGSKYFPSFKNSILLLEEIGEPPYRIDRMFNQLKLAGVFDNINGVILGKFIDCYETDPSKKSLSLNEIISDYFSDRKYPLIYNVHHGHTTENITLPLGINYKINASKKFIEITESCVS